MLRMLKRPGSYVWELCESCAACLVPCRIFSIDPHHCILPQHISPVSEHKVEM